MYLRELEQNDKESILDLCEEIRQTDDNFEGLDFLKEVNEFNYSELLEMLENNKHQEKIRNDYSTETFYVAVDDSEGIIGGIVFRHELKGNLINHGGNIGYLIRPTERRKKYGTMMLQLAIEKCKEKGLKRILISCRDTNIASAKVIQKNGGIYENDYYDETTDIRYKRFWINI